MNPDHAKRIRQRIETMNKLRGRPLTNVEKLANIRRAFDEEDAMNKDHAKRVLEHQSKQIPQQIIAQWLCETFLKPVSDMNRITPKLIERLVDAGYTIEPIEDDHED